MDTRTAKKTDFRAHDGQLLFYRHWPATGSHCRGAIVLLYSGQEHSGRVARWVEEINLPAFAFFSWDTRGSGRWPDAHGRSPCIAAMVRDLQALAEHIRDAHGIAIEDMALVGQRAGAVLAAAWVHDYAPPVRCLAVATPAFDSKLDVLCALPVLRGVQKLRDLNHIHSDVLPKFLTLLDRHDTAQRIVTDAAAIIAPALMLRSGTGAAMGPSPQDRFYERLSSARKERIVLPGLDHDALGWCNQAQALESLRAFVLREFDAPQPRVSLVDADRHGPPYDEYVRLTQAPANPLARVFWASIRAGLKLAGVFSNGIALGLKLGFDAGPTFDYVYRNQAHGRLGIGWLIDLVFLNSPAWYAVRQRKAHVEELIGVAMGRLHAAGMAARIVDLAAGPGRCVLDAVAALAPGSGGSSNRSAHAPESIVLRDYSPPNVEAGRALIAQRGLDAVARFELGDAFDEAGLAALAPRPTLAVAAGLYELFSENALIERSLRGLAQAMPAGGYLVYTGHLWNPMHTFMARALGNHRGGSHWILRRRWQAELDELVVRAGFRKVTQRIDNKGMLSVSLVQRIEAA